MKKYFALLMIAALGFTVSCSKLAMSPEAEAKALMNDMIKLVDTTSDKLEKATTGKEAADALVAFSTGMKAMAEKGKEFDKKNPGIKVETSEAFNAEREKMKKSMDRFSNASISAMTKFKDSPEMMEAAKKMAQ